MIGLTDLSQSIFFLGLDGWMFSLDLFSFCFGRRKLCPLTFLRGAALII